ncbi:MAG: DUF4364 family protein, partial [Clostridia bacterium]|nr:DUF4364 family protein [Clostridia bacterium]
MGSMLKDPHEIKIFILYLMDRIGYAMNYSTIGAIMIQDGIVAFFDFAECFFALVDAGHIRVIHPQKQSPEDDEPEALYEVSETGRI